MHPAHTSSEPRPNAQTRHCPFRPRAPFGQHTVAYALNGACCSGRRASFANTRSLGGRTATNGPSYTSSPGLPARIPRPPAPRFAQRPARPTRSRSAPAAPTCTISRIAHGRRMPRLRNSYDGLCDSGRTHTPAPDTVTDARSPRPLVSPTDKNTSGTFSTGTRHHEARTARSRPGRGLSLRPCPPSQPRPRGPARRPARLSQPNGRVHAHGRAPPPHLGAVGRDKTLVGVAGFMGGSDAHTPTSRVPPASRARNRRRGAHTLPCARGAGPALFRPVWGSVARGDRRRASAGRRRLAGEFARHRRVSGCPKRHGRLYAPGRVCAPRFGAIRAEYICVRPRDFMGGNPASSTDSRAPPPSRVRRPRDFGGALASTPAIGSATDEDWRRLCARGGRHSVCACTRRRLGGFARARLIPGRRGRNGGVYASPSDSASAFAGICGTTAVAHMDGADEIPRGGM
ncbi:hypothetical protein VTO73DRAFT_15449 [Trametes versicolor]